MKTIRFVAVLLMLGGTMSLSGCSSFCGHAMRAPNDEQMILYPGVKADAMYCVFVPYLAPLAIIDMPFSAFLDTVFLPYDLCIRHVYRIRRERETRNPQPVDFRGHTYMLIGTPMRWHDARKHAESLGGHLATVMSREEDFFLVSLVRKSYTGTDAVYLGATDEQKEAEWVWVTGEPFGYCHWRGGKPDQAKNEYDYLVLRGGYAWWDAVGDEPRGFIVEFE